MRYNRGSDGLHQGKGECRGQRTEKAKAKARELAEQGLDRRGFQEIRKLRSVLIAGRQGIQPRTVRKAVAILDSAPVLGAEKPAT